MKDFTRRLLVTGATGSLGSVVAARFAGEGHLVRSLVRSGSALAGETVTADLTDREAIFRAAEGVEAAVHCAALGGSDLDLCRRVNVEGTRHLVDALVAGGCRRLVHVSTITVYDDEAGASTFDDSSPTWTTPRSAYGFTKAEAERIVLAANGPRLGVVVLRPGIILSMHPRSRWGPLAIERARASEESIMPFPEMPYVHVENLVDAIALAMCSPIARGRTYNVVDGSADTTEYLAAVYGAIGRAPPPIPPGAVRERFPATRIRHELGWTPKERWGEFLDELARYSTKLGLSPCS